MRLRAGLFLACLAALPLAAGCGGKSEPVIKVGFSGPLTGDQAPLGEDMMHGAQLAIDQANARGEVIPGFKLQLAAMDDQRSPTQAVTVAKKLVSDPDIVAVIGHLNSNCTMPASAVYHQARILNISPASSNPQISRQGFDTFYRTSATDDMQGLGAANFAYNDLGARRVFILDDMTTYGRGFSTEVEGHLKRMGAEVIGHEGINQGDKDFVPLLTKIKSQNPDLLFFAGMFPEGALLIKQRSDIGLPAPFMGGDGLFDPALIELAGGAPAEGAHLTTITTDISQIPTAKAFLEAYEARYGPVGAYSAYAYEAANIVIWAIQQAAKKDRAAVLAAMKEFKDFPGIFGPANFDQKGDPIGREIGIFTVENGKFKFVKTAAAH